MNHTTGHNPFVIAIGGGKGGTGKSTVSCGIAACLAKAGSRAILADLDFGAANLHTMTGIHSTGRSIVHFLYPDGGVRCTLAECLVKTENNKLLLLPGDGFMPGMANMEFAKKQKLIRNLKQLHGEYIVCDLGAGSSYNVIDFFLAADLGILVLTTETTAILNGYEFMKNCIFRKIIRGFRKTEDAAAYIENYRKTRSGQSGSSVHDLINNLESRFPGTGKTVESLCRAYSPIIFFNRENGIRKDLGSKLASLGKKYLNIEIIYGGTIPEEKNIGYAPLPGSQGNLSSPYWEKIQKIARFIEKRRTRHNQQAVSDI